MKPAAPFFMAFTGAIAFLFSSIPAPPASAAPGEVDHTFATGHGAFNHDIYAVAVQPDGKVIVAGTFYNAGGQPTIDNVARLHPNGTIDTTFAPGDDALNNSVNCIVLQPGKVIVAGSFTNAGGNPAIDRVARLNANGTIDPTFAPGSFATNNSVLTVALQPDGKVIIAGFFTNAGGNHDIDRIARLNTNGTIDPTFAAGDGTFDGGVSSVALQADGKVIIAGSFTDVGDNPAIDRVARLNPNGTIDTTFAPGDGALDDDVYTFALQADGKLIIAGPFDNASDNPAIDGVARLNANGTIDTTFAAGSGALGSPIFYALAVQPDGKVIVAGSFTDAGDNPAIDDIVRLDNGAATSSLTVPTLSQIRWERGGTAPEASFVSFEYSTTGTAPWTFLGLGTRISGGWQLTGTSIPDAATVRALAFVPSAGGGSSGIAGATATTSWTGFYNQAGFYYTYFASISQTGTGLAYWFYFRAYGDQAYYNALGHNGYAQFKFYEDLAYFYYTFYKNSAPNLAAYFLYLNFAYPYLDYLTISGDPASGNAYYNTYYALALAAL